MKILKSSLFVFLALNSVVTPLKADEVPAVVVSATRSSQSAVTTPASITIITSDDIAASGAQHIAEVLRIQAGIQIRDLYGDGSRTAISMRGFSGGTAASNTLIMVDGRRLNNIDLGSPNLNSISLKDVERIEIIQGSAGTLFGDQAVGGVINIITRQGDAAQAEVEAGVGSYNKRRLAAQLSNTLTDKLQLRLSAEALKSDNYRDHNEKDYLNGFARLDYQVANGNWFAELQGINEELQLPGSLTASEAQSNPRMANPFYPNDYNDVTTYSERLGTRQTLTSTLQLEAELSHRKEDIDGIGYDTAFTQAKQSTGLTPRLIHNWSTAHGDALLTVGVDYEDNDYRYDSSVSYISDVMATQTNWALYTQLVLPLTESLTGTLGARYANVDNHIVDSASYPNGLDISDHVTVGEIGLSWKLDPAWRLFLRHDGNFRFAKVDEQTYTPAGTMGLNTQTGTSYELGTEWHSGRHQAKLLAYRLDLDNEIDFDNTAPGPGAFPGANINLPPTQRKGVMLEGKSNITQTLTASGQITYIDATITGGSFAGNTIPFVAEHEASIALTYQATQSWNAYLEAHYTGERYQDSDYDNTLSKLPGFTVYNLHLRYLQAKWSTGLRINNVTDKQYISYATYNGYYPAPERNYELYANYRF